MDINTAATAGTLAAQIQALQGLIAQLTQAQTEQWVLVTCNINPPQSGTTLGVSQISLLPNGPANTVDFAAAITTALATYNATLSALQAELAALA